MPTPFTHLEVAQRLLRDESIRAAQRALLEQERAAFLLGNIAADARVDAGVKRETTHFYAYDRPMTDHPWRVMMQQHPDLKTARSPAQSAFLAGYVAHLSIDEAWGAELVRPRFVQHDWNASREQRFLMLNIILIYMDERDLTRLEPLHAVSLPQARPDSWVPFMSDAALVAWRDFIGGQLPPNGHSQTLQVLGERIGKQPRELRAILDSRLRMEADLWTHVPRDFLAQAEAKMYAFACQQMGAYLDEYGYTRG